MGCQQIDGKLVRDRAVSVDEAAAAWRKNPEGYLFIDSRTQADHAARCIPGSRRVDPWQIEPKDPDPVFDRYKELFIYGENAGSSRAEALTKRFYHAKQNHARLLEGGLEEWSRRGYPVEKAPAVDAPASKP